jgi:hypothetical protein
MVGLGSRVRLALLGPAPLVAGLTGFQAELTRARLDACFDRVEPLVASSHLWRRQGQQVYQGFSGMRNFSREERRSHDMSMCEKGEGRGGKGL